MHRKRTASGTSQLSTAQTASAPIQTPTCSSKGKWAYFFLAAAAFCVCLLSIFEVILRLAGYGDPASFLVRREINGTRVLVENPRYGWSDSGPVSIGSLSPVVLQSKKPAGVYRIFLFGESAALGEPRPAYGVGRYLETLLRDRFPGASFEVACMAASGLDLPAIMSMVRECAAYEGDLWIFYLGNNEFMGRLGGDTTRGASDLSIQPARGWPIWRRIRMGQWLADLKARSQGDSLKPTDRGDLKPSIDYRLVPGDPRKERVYENFRLNLDAMVQAGIRAEVPVLLCEMASNMKDCGPFGSAHVPPLSSDAQTEWQKLHDLGTCAIREKQWEEAISAFERALRLSPHFADTHFQLGCCQLAMSNHDAAWKSFERARDADTLVFRADSRLNRIIEETGRRYAGKGVVFVDTMKALARFSPDRIPGRESFLDPVQLNPDGSYRLARTLAEEVIPRLPQALKASQTAEWATPEACALRLGLTDWNRHAIFEEVYRHLLDAPYTHQVNSANFVRQHFDDLNRLKTTVRSGHVNQARAVYEESIAFRPQDFWLYENYAEFLEATGDTAKAELAWKKVAELLPHHPLGHYQSGRLLVRQRKFDEARMALKQALSLRPDLGEVYMELGQLAGGRGEWDEALRHFADAQRLRPNDARILMYRADLLARQQNRPEAILNLRGAIELKPSYWEARYLLGVEWAVDEKIAEAQAEFAEVVRLRPDHVLGHLNLGVALALQQKYAEALEHFQETLRLDPQNQSARQHIETIGKMQQGNPE
ncbi:MAG TPA: tetratricopeptide repeat protein [Candidatus Paceibacterota bacterium]|nr:tetratricopeptide repeat protein [Candidatus Paceibacterota bacterium]